MADVFSRDKRSAIMSRIHGTNTKPEMLVRKTLFSMGFRYRIHCKKLPGKPDIVLPSQRKVIFVHGCFWHGHQNCNRSKTPSTNVEFWQAKIGNTIERDRKSLDLLIGLGWKVLTIWTCEIRSKEGLERKLKGFLNVRTSERL
ncbi:MAG: very short patch repair endonuclease [Syntrophobacteraceae bacterium]